MSEWFADEAFWETLYPFLFPQERFEAADEQVEKILRLVEFAGRDVLDLCCGPGRHSVALARRGLAVTGVDRSPFLLAKAKERALAAEVTVNWVAEDMRRFVRPKAFDLALSLFTSFGYFPDPEDDLRVLRNIRANLRDGGALVIDLSGKEIVARRYEGTSSTAAGDALLVERLSVKDDWSGLRNTWIVIRGESARSFEFDLRLYSAVELRTRLEEAGFRDVRTFGDLDGHPYGADAKRLIAVARA